MKLSIISIGNSKGIRIPKAILKQCQFDKEAEIEVRDDKLIIKPVEKKPRNGWKAAFSSMRKRDEDSLLVGDLLDREMKDWEW